MINQSIRISLLVIIIGLAANQPVWATNYYCADDTYQPDCSSHGGYLCMNQVAVMQAQYCDSLAGFGGLYTPYCGNERVDTGIGEQCDDGSQNSDTDRDGCRSNCWRAHCGDRVADSNEECDGDDVKGAICSDFDAQGNITYSDYYWPGSPGLTCKYDCTLDLSECDYCGDGVTQAPHEQCDDSNNLNDDGCNNDCTSCVQLTGNIDITTDTELCSTVFNVTDYGDEGVIIVKHPDITLDCDGATLIGQGVGVGIYVKMSNNVSIRNCTVTGYAVGVKIVDSQNVNFLSSGNQISGNTQPLVTENSHLTLPQAQAVTDNPASSAAGINAILKKDPPKSQPGSKFQTGAKPRGLMKPGGSSRSKLPVRQPMIKPPGKKTAPLGTPLPGRKTGKGLSPAPPAPLGPKIMPVAPSGAKSMPPDPLENKKTMPIDSLDKSSMPPDPLDNKIMPVNPLGR